MHAHVQACSCAGCHAGGGNVVQAGATLSTSDLKKNGVADSKAIYDLIYGGTGKMPGYGKDCAPRVRILLQPCCLTCDMPVLHILNTEGCVLSRTADCGSASPTCLARDTTSVSACPNSTWHCRADVCAASVQGKCTFGPRLPDEEIQQLADYTLEQAAAGWK